MIGKEPRTDGAKPNLRHHQGERVNQRYVKHVVEERYASEDDNSASDRPMQPFEKWNQRDDGPKRHQQETQRRRIFGRIQEREPSRHRRQSVSSLRGGMPWTRIAIQVKSAQHQKQSHGRESHRQTKPFSLGCRQDQYSAESVTRRHNPNPRNDRIENDQVWAIRTKLNRTREEPHIQYFPKAGEFV